MRIFRNFSKLIKDIKGLKRIWPFVKQEKKLLIIAVILIPVISIIQMLLPIVLQRTIDEGVLVNDFEKISIGAAFYLLLVVSGYIVRSVQTLISALSVHRGIKRTRKFLISHILKLKASFHDHNMSGKLATRATSDFDGLSESLNQGVLNAIVDIFVLIGIISGMFYLNWQLASFTFLVLPLVALIVVTFSRILKRAMLLARSKLASVNAYTQECLYGNTTIKLLTAEEESTEHFKELTKEYRNTQMKSVIFDGILTAVLDGLASITIGFFLWLTVSPFIQSDLITTGLIVAFVSYIQHLFEPLKQLGNRIAMLQGAFTSLDRIFSIMDVEDFIHGDETINSFKGNISFNNVTFSYSDEEGSATILKNISFSTKEGETIALVGRTGSGKSTIIKLITKLYDGYKGEILVDSNDLRSIDGSSLRSKIGMVPQDIVLFKGSISFNITLGDESITKEDIITASKLVGIHDFIETLPQKYENEIKESGDNLSHGQKQLIIFARAIAKKPSVIILDEATSSVDPESENAIQNAISTIMKGHTVIVIAHRLSTIEQCDKILVLSQGELAEQGNHHSLMDKKGIYHRLYAAKG